MAQSNNNINNLNIPYNSNKKFIRGKSLVFAPHPDDEVFGCGGAIIRHIEQGDNIKVVIVTDGGLAVVESQKKPDYINIRQKESKNASKILGYDQIEFLNYKDGNLQHSQTLTDHFLKIINEFNPKNIYSPSEHESHNDHLVVNRTVLEAIKLYSFDIKIINYEIGQTLIPNYLHDITDLHEKLNSAMLCFESQLAALDYIKYIDALHTYRSITMGRKVKYAEAYRIINSYELKPKTSSLSTKKEIIINTDSNHHNKSIPLVSVIIRSINRPAINEAIKSIENQTYTNIEIVIVDASGNGEIKDLTNTKKFTIKYISTGKQHNRPEAANIGLESFSGDYFCFLDDDDQFFENHIYTLIEGIKKTKSPVVYSGTKINNSKTGKTKLLNKEFNRNMLLFENYIPIHAVLYHRIVKDSGCRFDPDLEFYEDWDFLLQVSNILEIRHINHITSIYNVSDSSEIWHSLSTQREYRIKIIQKWILTLSPESIDSYTNYLCSFQKNLADEIKIENDNLKSKTAELIEQKKQSDVELKNTMSQNQLHIDKIEKLNLQIENNFKTLKDLEQQLKEKTDEFILIQKSRSWKITKPIRVIKAKISKFYN